MDSIEKTKLLPCPFCGRQPDLEDHDTLYPAGIYWREEPEIDGLRTYWRRSDRKEGDGTCYTMHCPTPSGGCGAEITGDSQEETVNLWNRRNHGALQIAITEAVRRATDLSGRKIARLRAENEALREQPNPAAAAIQYVLRHQCDSPIEFLNCWMYGDFDALRKEWDNVPDAVFIGADPLLPAPPKGDE